MRAAGPYNPRGMFKRLILIVIVLAVVAGGVYALRAKKLHEMAAMRQQAMPATAVSVAVVQAESWLQSLFAVGSVAAEQGIDVTTPLPGTVVDIHFDSGQNVTRGQILAQLDVGVDVAELDGLIAARELRELQFERAAMLLKKSQVSQSDYDSARAARDEAEAAVRAKREYIARKKIYAPFDGTLGIRMVDLGEHVDPGDPLVPLQMLDPIHVDYALPEHLLSRLLIEQAVEVEVRAYPRERFRGRITAFDPGIDPGTRNIRIRATITNADRRLRPGMFAQVWTLESAPKAVLTLPETAVTYSPYGDTVFVVVAGDAGDMIERRQVETGEVRDGRVEIIGGIALGERVVAVGQNKLRNDMPVRVSESVPGALAADTP